MRKTGSFIITGVLVLAVGMLLYSCSSKSNPTSSSGGGVGGGNPNAVTISGFAFNPSSTTVKMGTTVTWTNNDAVTHTVTSDDGKFTSSGNLGQGAKYSYTFNTAGSYPYHCSIHPSMTGTITVTP
ncbi:exported hypothetical protein [Candidatus Zixiibacteriota bacterium]|nr:exported hypothetical protein [candidate division Zixibacteria bacterium]